MTRRLLTTEEVVAHFREVHGDSYDYSKVEYKGSKTKVLIGCNTCKDQGKEDHWFFQIPNSHKIGHGCPKCFSESRRLTTEKVISQFREIHGSRFDYSRVEYKGSKTKVLIGCNTCKDLGKEDPWFFQTPLNHKQGQGCLNCSGKRRLTTEKVISQFREIHGSKFDYSKVEYQNTQSKVLIGCNTCKDLGIEDPWFFQTPLNHKQGQGCPECCVGKSERLFGDILKELGFSFKKIRPNWLLNPETDFALELDFYSEDLNVAFEVQGIQHYKHIEYFGGLENFKKLQKRDELKRELCKDHGVTLIEYDLRIGKDKKSMTKFILENIKTLEVV